MIEAQKAFWFREAILEAMATSKVTRLVSAITVALKRGLGVQAKSYYIYDCDFIFHIKFTDLPGFVRALLASKLTFEVRELSVSKFDFKRIITSPANIRINSAAENKIFDKDVYSAKFPEGKTEYKGTEEDLVPEPIVQVKMRLAGLDFIPKAAPAKQP